MKLTFFGTSHGHSEPNRYCTSVAFEHNGHIFFIDLGAPVEYLMTTKNVDFDAVEAYFITHMHADHVADLPTIIKDYDVYNKKSTAELFLPDENAVEPLKNWANAIHLSNNVYERLKINIVHSGLIYDKFGIKVTAIRTEHISKDVPSFAYMVETDDGKRVLFTGDLARNHTDFPKIAKETQFNLIVSELVHISPIDTINETMADVKTDMLIFSHLGKYNIEKLETLDINLPFHFVVANDGFEYNVI
ncbi:MAG: MBL fold metallo-hydrolase [Ruminococcaceae bacterium]|nr:MBL fold metallo-hydrolase [Oscillospiraceae bacterium]